MKEYKIYIGDKFIGRTELENADPPMGVVFGKIIPNIELNYNLLKNLCKLKKIHIADDIPEDKFISTMNSNQLKVKNEKGVEIKGEGNQISGMNKYGYEISIFGIPYPFYEDEFPDHVKEYESKFK